MSNEEDPRERFRKTLEKVLNLAEKKMGDEDVNTSEVLSIIREARGLYKLLSDYCIKEIPNREEIEYDIYDKVIDCFQKIDVPNEILKDFQDCWKSNYGE